MLSRYVSWLTLLPVNHCMTYTINNGRWIRKEAVVAQTQDRITALWAPLRQTVSLPRFQSDTRTATVCKTQALAWYATRFVICVYACKVLSYTFTRHHHPSPWRIRLNRLQRIPLCYCGIETFTMLKGHLRTPQAELAASSGQAIFSPTKLLLNNFKKWITEEGDRYVCSKQSFHRQCLLPR
jgi:hypothetical protein